MFGKLRNVFGAVTVEEGFLGITITGIDVTKLNKDIHKLWGSKRIEKHMITILGNYSFKFDFFIVC